MYEPGRSTDAEAFDGVVGDSASMADCNGEADLVWVTSPCGVADLLVAGLVVAEPASPDEEELHAVIASATRASGAAMRTMRVSVMTLCNRTRSGNGARIPYSSLTAARCGV